MYSFGVRQASQVWEVLAVEMIVLNQMQWNMTLRDVNTDSALPGLAVLLTVS